MVIGLCVGRKTLAVSVCFIWLGWVVVVAPGIFDLCCGMPDQVPWPGIKPRPPELVAQSLSPWTTRKSHPWRFKKVFPNSSHKWSWSAGDARGCPWGWDGEEWHKIQCVPFALLASESIRASVFSLTKVSPQHPFVPCFFSSKISTATH